MPHPPEGGAPTHPPPPPGQPRRIVVAVGGGGDALGSDALDAIQWAADHLRRSDQDVLHVLHVVPVGASAQWAGLTADASASLGATAASQAGAAEELWTKRSAELLAPPLQAQGIRFEIDAIAADSPVPEVAAASAVCDFAAEMRAAAVVMVEHRPPASGFLGWLMGGGVADRAMPECGGAPLVLLRTTCSGGGGGGSGEAFNGSK